jgi:hypothetical protein
MSMSEGIAMPSHEHLDDYAGLREEIVNIVSHYWVGSKTQEPFVRQWTPVGDDDDCQGALQIVGRILSGGREHFLINEWQVRQLAAQIAIKSRVSQVLEVDTATNLLQYRAEVPVGVRAEIADLILSMTRGGIAN